MEEHAIDTSVGSLVVRTTGSGAPAVLWHSLFVDDRSWDRLVPDLAQDRRLVVICGPGHGRSGDPGRRYSNEECAAAAVQILDRLGVSAPVDWVGNAWGGHVGVIFAASQPERCRSLVVIGAPVAALTRRERARTYLLLGLYRLLGSSGAVVNGVTKVLLSPHTRANDPEAVRMVQVCLRRADRRMLRNAVVSISLHRRDMTDLLAQVSAPTLVVTGSDHQGFTPPRAEAAARLLRHGTVSVVPDASYLVPLEAPAVCSQVIREFWADRCNSLPQDDRPADRVRRRRP